MGKAAGRTFLARLLLATVGAAAFAGAGAAIAQDAPVSDPRGVVENFDARHVGPLLTELGVVWQEGQLNSGGRVIKASIGNFSFMIVPMACRNEAAQLGCVGANLVALYEGLTPNSQTVSAFNQHYVFTSAGALPGGAGAYLSRYEIADYGIPRGNLASSIGSFVYLADTFRKEIASGRRTVSLDGYADDMSARRLNGRMSEALGFETVNRTLAAYAPVNRAALHRAGFETTTETVKALLDWSGAPKNKISNLTAE